MLLKLVKPAQAPLLRLAGRQTGRCGGVAHLQLLLGGGRLQLRRALPLVQLDLVQLAQHLLLGRHLLLLRALPLRLPSTAAPATRPGAMQRLV